MVNKLIWAGLVVKMELWQCLLFISSILVPSSLCQSNGDVFLSNVTTRNSLKEGLLQIYYNDSAGTICYTGFNMYAAHAACRELGYVTAHGFNRAGDTMYNTLNTQVLLTNVNCPKVNNPALDGALHILRCSYNTTATQLCTSDNSVVLTCNTEKLRENPYDSQVLLKDPQATIGVQTPSNGAVQVYLHNEWGYVCYHQGFTLEIADTVCLQKGFTNARSISFIDDSLSEVYWLSDVYCSKVFSCFSECYNYPKKSEVLDNCVNNRVVQITCEFNTSFNNTAGSRKSCNIPFGSDKKISNAFVAVLVTFFIVIVVIVIAIFVTCYYFTKCPLYMYRRRKYYRSIV